MASFQPARRLCGVVGLCCVVLLLAGCERRAPAPVAADAGAEERPAQESWDVHLFISETPRLGQESVPRMQIRAGYMALYERPDSTFTLLTAGPDSLAHAARPTVYLFQEGDTSAVVTADRTLYYDQQGRFEAFDEVRVTTPDDRTLETEHLIWDERERKVRTPGFARITTPTEQIQGYGLVADEDLSTYALGRVTGQVLVEEP